MIKYLVLLINLVGLFVYQVFMQSGVTATQTAPASANPGSSFTVEVTINKASATGFAKYQADLPQGCTASAVNKNGATVLASGNAIKFLWASLPSDQTLKISYTVTQSKHSSAILIYSRCGTSLRKIGLVFSKAGSTGFIDRYLDCERRPGVGACWGCLSGSHSRLHKYLVNE